MESNIAAETFDIVLFSSAAVMGCQCYNQQHSVESNIVPETGDIILFRKLELPAQIGRRLLCMGLFLQIARLRDDHP